LDKSAEFRAFSAGIDIVTSRFAVQFFSFMSADFCQAPGGSLADASSGHQATRQRPIRNQS